MPTPTYDLIAYGTTIAEAVNFDFTNIGSSYRDLILIIGATNSTSAKTSIQFNSTGGTDYHFVVMSGNGSTASSNSTAGASSMEITSSTTGAFLCQVNILDYAESKHKTVLARNSLPSGVVDARAGRWGNTSAVTSINITTNGSWPAGAMFYLYGIVA